MPLSAQQVEQFRQQALAAGKSPADIERYIASKGYAAQGSGTARLAAQFEGTQAAPTSSIRGVGQDPGSIGMAGASLKENVVGPFVGIAERLGIADEGSRQDIRGEFEDTRVDYLANDPSALRTILAGLTEAGAMAIPLTPGGPIGKLGAKAAYKLGAKAVGTKVAAGAAAGLAEGALVGVGDTIGLPLADQLKQGGLMALAGAGFGTLGGLRGAEEVRGILKDADPKTAEFLNTYIAENPQSRGILDRPREIALKIRNHWVDSFASAGDITKKVARRLKQDGAPKSELDVVKAQEAEMELRFHAARTADQTALDPIERGGRLIP